jgi:hypothetical protein
MKALISQKVDALQLANLTLQLSLDQPTNSKGIPRNPMRNKSTLPATKEIRLPEIFVAWQPYKFIFIFLMTKDRSNKLFI